MLYYYQKLKCLIKKQMNYHPRYAIRSRTGCRGDGGLSATAPAYQPSSRVRNSSQLPPNQRHIHLVEVKYCEDTRPRSQLEAAHHQHSVLRQHLHQAAGNVSLHTILLGVGGTIYSPYSLAPLRHLGLDPQKVTKLAVKLKKLLLQIIKTRNGVLPVIPLIPTDSFCSLWWWRSHTVPRP